MGKYGCSPSFITMVQHFSDCMQCWKSEPFRVTNRVKRGCVLSPTLFSIMFSAWLTDAFREVGISFRYRIGRTLLLIRWLLVKSVKCQTSYSQLILPSMLAVRNNMQYSGDRFSIMCLTINTKKTEVQHQPAPGKPFVKLSITVVFERRLVCFQDRWTYSQKLQPLIKHGLQESVLPLADYKTKYGTEETWSCWPS